MCVCVRVCVCACVPLALKLQRKVEDEMGGKFEFFSFTIFCWVGLVFWKDCKLERRWSVLDTDWC